MKFITLILLLALAPLAWAVQADPTSGTQGADKLFFEPTQDDYDTSWRAIGDQRDRYLQAKDNQAWEEARALAMFHFQVAWLYNNEAYAYIQTGQDAKEGLTNAEALLLQAIKSAEAEKLPKFKAEAADCLKKAKKNLAAVRTRLDVFKRE